MFQAYMRYLFPHAKVIKIIEKNEENYTKYCNNLQ